MHQKCQCSAAWRGNGKEFGCQGQNVRLAARLTGWKIDIGPESQAEQIIEEMETLRRETQEQIDKAVEDLFADEEF